MQDTPPDVFSTPPQLDGELVTLTLLPRSRWQTLLNLEVIQVKFTIFLFLFPCSEQVIRAQQRNKPKEPPKAPEKAPFFLATLPGVESRFAIKPKDETQSTKPTRRLEKTAAASESMFLKTLVDDDTDGDCE